MQNAKLDMTEFKAWLTAVVIIGLGMAAVPLPASSSATIHTPVSQGTAPGASAAVLKRPAASVLRDGSLAPGSPLGLSGSLAYPKSPIITVPGTPMPTSPVAIAVFEPGADLAAAVPQAPRSLPSVEHAAPAGRGSMAASALQAGPAALRIPGALPALVMSAAPEDKTAARSSIQGFSFQIEQAVKEGRTAELFVGAAARQNGPQLAYGDPALSPAQAVQAARMHSDAYTTNEMIESYVNAHIGSLSWPDVQVLISGLRRTLSRTTFGGDLGVRNGIVEAYFRRNVMTMTPAQAVEVSGSLDAAEQAYDTNVLIEQYFLARTRSLGWADVQVLLSGLRRTLAPYTYGGYLTVRDSITEAFMGRAVAKR